MLKNLICFFMVTGVMFSVDASVKHKDRQLDVPSSSKLEHRVTPQGRIIFVTGSCSSGKSSMSKVIAQKLNAKFFNFDEYVMPIVLKKFITKHYGKFLAFFIGGLVMRNFFTAVNLLSDKKKYEFQKKFYNDLRQGLADEPTTRMFSEVKNVAMQGQDVVVESPMFLWDGVDFLSNLAVFEGTDITYVLAYCPWNDLVDRLRQRNLSKNTKIRRELDWVVINYMYCFDVTPNYRGDSSLEYLRGGDVQKTIAEYSQRKYKKKRLCLLPETQQIALQKFPEDIGYYVYPRFEHDVTVNTKINTIEQGAQVVLDYLRK